MSSFSYRKLRAPEADGTALIDPPASAIQRIVAECAQHFRAANRKADVLGPLRSTARRSVLELASSYTSAYSASKAALLDAEQPILMSGHQPDLFHPGVWFKNFLLSSVARRCSAWAINLIVDNDFVRREYILIPTSNARGFYGASFDRASGRFPWEERRLRYRDLFVSFAKNVRIGLESCGRMAPRVPRLVVERMWPTSAILDDDLRHTDRLGLLLARNRHRLEANIGLSTLELPLSRLADTREFRQFMAMILSELASFAHHHNQSLHEYRLTNHIRSRSHPVADLSFDAEWIEAPLWIWTTKHPMRQRVFVHRRGHELVISDHNRVEFSIDGRSDWNEAAEQLEAAEVRGIKVRPRALITTMYSRLVLSDLFIHGIGGAKYDELTDEIIRRFFGIEPPRYLTATATFRLPIDRPNVSIEDVRDAARLVRDVRYRPETLVGHPLVASDAGLERELQALAAEKREYVRTHTLRRASHDVFAGLDRINASLHEKLQPLERHLRFEHARLVELAKQARTLGSREFSFVLYPEEYLVPRLLALAAAEK